MGKIPKQNKRPRLVEYSIWITRDEKSIRWRNREEPEL